MTAKAELWWVSVGGNDSEVAQLVTNNDGTRDVYTIGCNDPTRFVDGCGVELIQQIYDAPKNYAQRAVLKAEWEEKREADRKRGIHHSYRMFP